MTIHDMVRRLVEVIYKEHGVCVQTVTILWKDESTLDEKKICVGEIVIRTRSE